MNNEKMKICKLVIPVIVNNVSDGFMFVILSEVKDLIQTCIHDFSEIADQVRSDNRIFVIKFGDYYKGRVHQIAP
jgi:hypothetical protein